MSEIPVGIVGARGYTGGELLRYLVQHPRLQVAYVTSESQAGEPVAAAFPSLRGLLDLPFSRFDPAEAAAAAQLLFLALPDGEAMQHAPALLEAGAKVVDLSGDFRVKDPAAYERWYKREHLAPELLEKAAYGLPEFHKGEVLLARLVANPGCYPTAALLALAPLASLGLLQPGGVVIDAKSGVSGAGGRAALGEAFSFTNVNENFRAYGVTGHRHVAEMEQELALLTPDRQAQPLTFTPHLLPITRGILVTCYVTLPRPVDEAQIRALYSEDNEMGPFVRFQATPPQVRQVAGTNRCLVWATADERTQRAIVVAAIDNLGKGAAGQAVQNANLMLGLEETDGLLGPALTP